MTSSSSGDDPSKEEPISLSLHDSLALGEIEAGLLAQKQNRSEIDEIQRLPVLLRLLSSSRPLSSIPTFDTATEESESEVAANSTPIDELANEVVARLEDVAATYSVAEGVDVVACHLAPTICRNLSKLPPLKKRKRDCQWETNDLVVIGATPRSRQNKKRRRDSDTQSLTRTDSADELNLETDDLSAEEAGGAGGMSSDDDDKIAGSLHGGYSSSNRRYSRRASADAGITGSEDSQEEVVSKTLSDLSALVVASLEPIRADSNDKAGEEGTTAFLRKGNLALAMDDSALSEPSRGQMTTTTAESVGDVMTGSDLGATVAALMHHAPVLRHRHVANALCRASVPQAANLVKRMGANCPSAVPSLLRGCLDAYESASAAQSRHVNMIKNTSKSAVRALAKLSEREQSRIRTTLQADAAMIDVQLELAMAMAMTSNKDSVSASCLLLQHLIGSIQQKQTSSIAAGGRKMEDGGAYVDNPEEYGMPQVGEGCRDPSLREFLQDSPKLFTTVLQFLLRDLSTKLSQENLRPVLGPICLLLRSLTWLVLLCDVDKCVKTSNKVLPAFTELIPVLLSLLDKVNVLVEAKSKRADYVGVDDALRLSLCSCLLLFARLTPLSELDQSSRNKCESYVKSCFSLSSVNAKYGIFVARVCCPLRYGDSKAVYNLVKSILMSFPSFHCFFPELSSPLEEGIAQTCQWVKANVDLEKLLKEEGHINLSVDPSAMLDLMEDTDSTDGPIKEKIQESLTSLLGDYNDTSLGHERTPEFVVKATAFLSKSKSINLPIVSPLKLETLAAKVDLRQLEGQPAVNSVEYKFLFQVLYWFAYINVSEKDSLFTFDALALPLKEVLNCCEGLASKSRIFLPLNFYLNQLVAKKCPEIPLQTRRWVLTKQVIPEPLNKTEGTDYSRRKIKKSLSYALKSTLIDYSSDASGIAAERSFLLARKLLSDADLVATTVSTLLSRPHSPPPFYTYSMLCRDPLILLKAPMRVWQCQGLRRIVLSVLFCLLETNQGIIYASSPSDSAADDLVSSRNLLLLRCILIGASGTEEGCSLQHPAYVCSMTSNFLRMILAKNRGLVGLLIKQSPALPDNAIDWLVEFVPETMDDAQALSAVLSERGSLSARLTAAAAILRIAIAHGQRDEAASEALVYAALSQLIASFFLVVGPVGVPVNVLIGEGPDQDVTQTSRRATFRMLRSLVNVRGRLRTRLRSECGMALHKLAGLCKGENIVSGVAGAVVSRRKNLLREVFEAVSKASNAMGSGIDL